MKKVIDSFVGQYRFLSNFYGSDIVFEGHTYLNAEAAFQAAKCLNYDTREEFTSLNPSEAKRKGRRVALRRDWELIKDNVMYNVLIAKFKNNKRLAKLLIETEDAWLIEGNNWGDCYWGSM